MSLSFHNGSWRRGCPGCGAHGAACKWVNGALFVSCTECDSEFQYLSKISAARPGRVDQALG
jgi:hypothetical protein